MAKRGLGKGLGAFFGEEVANTKETSGEKVSRYFAEICNGHLRTDIVI